MNIEAHHQPGDTVGRDDSEGAFNPEYTDHDRQVDEIRAQREKEEAEKKGPGFWARIRANITRPADDDESSGSKYPYLGGTESDSSVGIGRQSSDAGM